MPVNAGPPCPPPELEKIIHVSRLYCPTRKAKTTMMIIPRATLSPVLHENGACFQHGMRIRRLSDLVKDCTPLRKTHWVYQHVKQARRMERRSRE